jgi:outer membrane protein assembly factor BamD (BamD/ComL family)
VRTQRPAAAAPAPAASSLAEEVRILDRVSASLSAHDSAGALTQLDAYRAKFPRGSMTLEATVLRIEALRQSGNGGAADALADDFLAKHPTSALAERVRVGKRTGGQ